MVLDCVSPRPTLSEMNHTLQAYGYVNWVPGLGES